jgi:MFS-type transporter involved in bile tolerance (Atg22 family)
VRTGTVGSTLNLNNTNSINMDTLMIIIAGVIAISAIAMILASRKIVKDDNNNKIPDWVEQKFADLKDEIKKLKK